MVDVTAGQGGAGANGKFPSLSEIGDMLRRGDLALAFGVLGAVAFVLWELRRREPMLDPRHFSRRGFAAGTLSITVQFFAAFGFLFLALPYLQLVMGYSPLQAAGALVPIALVVIPLSRKVPAIAARLGVRVTGAMGLSLMATGFIVLSTLELGSSYAHFLAGLLPFGAGMALAGAPATTAIVASLPRSKQGVASAVNDVSRELGGALGVAVLGSLLTGRYTAGMADAVAGLPAQVRDVAEGSLGGVHGLIAQGVLPPDTPVLEAAKESFVSGLTLAATVGAVVVVLAAVAVRRYLPSDRHNPQITGEADAGLEPTAVASD